MKKELWYAGLALAVGLGMGGCSSSDNTGPTGLSGTGTVNLSLTDAPATDSVVAAVFTISDVYFQKTDADSVSASNRVFLRQSVNTTVNLVTLRDSLRALVTGAAVPSGTYSQLRIVITGGYIQVRNAAGTISTYATPGFALPSGVTATGTLQAPSFSTSGLKVILPGSGITITNGSVTDLVADFDLAQSLGHAAGNSGMWVLHPVIKIVNLSSLSTLTVNVALGTGVSLPTGVTLSGFTVQVRDASGNLFTAPLVVTNGTASATFANLNPTSGPFQVTLVAPTGVSITTSTPTLPIAGVSLTSGGTTTETITLSAFGQ